MKIPNNQFICCDTPYAESHVVLFGAPYDSTTSFRPGTRFGPAAMRMESFGIETYSMLLDRDLAEDAAVFDAGDLELPFGDQETALKMIEDRAAEILRDGKVPFLLGGEHLVTLGSVRAVAKAVKDLYIIHFDAHADLREDYLGTPLSHACVMRRCWELVGDGKITQIGIRSGTREEAAFRRAGHVNIGKLPPKGSKVYLTIDMDCLDPAEFPGTGTPEAGGMHYADLIAQTRQVCADYDIVGLDNVELSPQLDPTGRSTALACKFLREELLCLLNLEN